jgi:hypothetical protein
VLHDYGPFHSSRSLSALANNGKRVDFSNIMAPLFLRLSGDRFYYVDSERPEVRVYHRLRGLTHIFRVPDSREARVPALTPFPARPPDASPLGTLLPTDEERAQAFATVNHRRFARYFSAMQVDLAGNIWLEDSAQEASYPGRYGTRRWFVFDSTGVLAARLTAPAAFVAGARLFAGGGPEIGNDYILVPRTNADGAPVVRMYRIHKERM